MRPSTIFVISGPRLLENPPSLSNLYIRRRHPLSAVTTIIAVTVVVVYYDGYPTLLRYSIPSGATCQWSIVYDLL